jgi:hypothetical protein
MPTSIDLATMTDDAVESTEVPASVEGLLHKLAAWLRQVAQNPDLQGELTEAADQLEAAAYDLGRAVAQNTPADDGTLDPEPRGEGMGQSGIGERARDETQS